MTHSHRSARSASAALLALGCLALAAAPASAQIAPPVTETHAVSVDSGPIFHRGDDLELVWTDLVQAPGADWLRIHFAEAALGLDPKTMESSQLRIISALDGHVQFLNAVTIREWDYTSAYFNGDAVIVELWAAPTGRENHVVIDQVIAGVPGAGAASICGPNDDRQLSDDPRAARDPGVGCSVWLIQDDHFQFLTAGHCTDFGGTRTVEFNVPLSGSNGSMRHPGPEDQYAVDLTSRQYVNAGIGNDWGYFGVFPNSNTGLMPYQAQGEAFELMMPPSTSGEQITITGYGTTSPPVPNEWNQVQKTHTGPFTSNSGTSVQYQTDTTGGNSGSPVILTSQDVAIGVHTHGGCGFSSGSNAGTGMDNSGLQNALANPRGVCAPLNLNVPTLISRQQATISFSGGNAGRDAFFIYTLQGINPAYNSFYGVVVDIANPVIGGTAVADASGNAQITVNIPRAARGRTLYIQGMQIGRKSQVETRVVQ